MKSNSESSSHPRPFVTGMALTMLPLLVAPFLGSEDLGKGLVVLANATALLPRLLLILDALGNMSPMHF